MNTRILVVLINLLLLTGCSTTMPDLGIKNNALMACPASPNCVNSQAEDDDHYITPISYAGSRQQAHSSLLQMLKTEKRTNVVSTQENYIRVEFTSFLFRFVDDVEFYFPEDQQGDETIIHIRSASRVGYSDLGANRKRVEHIRKLMAPEE